MIRIEQDLSSRPGTHRAGFAVSIALLSVVALSPDRAAAQLCSNYCEDASDGWCDDNGPGSDYSICDYGSDCNDCGSRPTGGASALYCSNTCVDRRDGWCDDGGPGSDFSLCDYGTDCYDCGARNVNDSSGGCAAMDAARGSRAPYATGLSCLALVAVVVARRRRRPKG